MLLGIYPRKKLKFMCTQTPVHKMFIAALSGATPTCQERRGPSTDDGSTEGAPHPAVLLSRKGTSYWYRQCLRGIFREFH